MRSLVRYFIIGVRVIFCNKALIISLSVVNLFLISGVVYKAINSKNELDKYETLRNQIINKMETKLVIHDTSSNTNEAHGVTRITNCLKDSISKDELDDNLLNIIGQIEDVMNASNLNFAFEYKEKHKDV